MVGVNFFYLVRNIFTHMPFLLPLKESLIFLIVFGILLYILEKGNWVRVNNETLDISKEYFKKKYIIKNIKRIYCDNQVFVGPTMFFEYRKDELSISNKNKILVLNQYRIEDKKMFLDFLAEKYPNIKQDNNCEKIRNMEKVLTHYENKGTSGF